MSAGKLPEGWVITTFTELLDVQGGTQPPKSEFISEMQDGYVRLLQIRDFGNKPVPTYIPDTSKLKKCKEEDLLIGRYGASLGRICTGHAGAYNVALAKVIIPKQLERSFVRYYLESEIFQFPLRLLSRSAQNGFNKDDLSKFNFVLVPLSEQKIIAEKLDTLLAQVDSTKARLEQIPQILKRFRQAVLGAAVSGKLTQNWRENNKTTPINKLLNKINEERNEARKNKKIKQNFGKYRPVLPLFQLPADCWEWVCFEQICETDNNALKAGPFGSALKKSDCVKSGHKVYGQEQVISGQESLETYRITEDKYQQLKSCATKPGDILISLVGTIGKTLILSNLAETGIINPRLVKIALHSEIQRQYVKLYLDGPLAYDFFKGFSHGGTMDILNLGILKELPIPLPSLEEQHEIVRRVEQLFAYADTIEKQVNNALARVNNLTQSILAKAFRGELTAQWRAENPELISGENSAAALLEKIKAERAASGGKKASRKKS
ncbi:restriction endonuclease subunit S [Escherichia albertii]|uniref:restriction endonuclease subunit S n=1 Tax=Escherichia albertii TaxID=208962 RepID=UPI000CF72616|nr:restriction endonuclease subunit S [Escherichia albertii]EFO1269730.1 restriction endonuclease subunit S [Escherichia albertii]MCZ8807524.1 restriction endonuclease subunit S [Escherichia albertii]MCZ8966153.1 restriction endonuclease subunit S [Escherichia albertii]MCZ9059989.1 restriction endonuclease subunit S [Escherichia albertii]